jgi:hypothetical protein
MQLTNLYVEAINASLYIIVFIFALGLFVLNILKFKPSFSCIEFFALAYPISIASLAIMGTVALLLPSNFRGTFALLAITSLSIISLFLALKEKQTKVNQYPNFTIKNDELVLLIILSIFAYFYIELYPAIASSPDLDIARNFLNALAFSKDRLGDFYSENSLYPLFGIYQSYMIYIVKPSVETFQIVTVFLNIFGILSFYAMASQYLKRYDNHIPVIATLIWATFAGFGWLNFLTRKIGNPNVPFFSLIGQTDAYSYGDITWRRLFFNLSMETSLILVFAVLYLLKRKDISKAKQIFLTSLLIAPCSLMHPYAIYFLFSVLLCFAFISFEEMGQQLKHISYSLLIASFFTLLLNYILNIETSAISINFTTFFEYLLISLAILTIITLRSRASKRLTIICNKVPNTTQIGVLVATSLLILYFSSLLLWLGGGLAFNFASLNRFGYVPWLLYPVKLGMTGILTIIVLYIIFKDPQNRSKELVALFASVLLMIFVSRLISTIQIQYASDFTFDPNSWFFESIRKTLLSFREERMFELFKIPLAIIASITLSKHIITKTKQRNSKASSNLMVTGLISLILISGMSSTILGFEYFHNTTQTSQPDPIELDAISNLRDRIYASGKSIIISPQTPPSYLYFTGATAIVTESPAAWASKSPELPLFVTRYSKTTPTYIYLHKIRDYSKISEYAGNYLEHVSSIAQVYLENQEVQIKMINNVSIPTPESSTALIIPYDELTRSVKKPFFQEALLQSTTLTLFFEEKMQSMNFYKEPIYYNNVDINGTAIFNGVNSYIRINGTGTNFNKILIEFQYQPLNITRNQVIVSKFNYGTPPRKSWEIAQYGKRICFKISPDGDKEEVLLTGEVVSLNTEYTIRAEYDGSMMKIFVNNKIVASRPYQMGIFKSNVDITIGAELYNNKPTAFANMILRYIRVLNSIPPATEPIFYAYDFLSLAGFNYTTILQNDITKNNYETLILPYDDITTNEMLTKLEASQQAIKAPHIVILNTNGYGPLLTLFGNISSQTFMANKIFTNRSITIQPVEVPIIQPYDNILIEAKYANSLHSSPLIMTTTRDNVTLIYINIYPLIQQNQLHNQTALQSLTETMSKYVKIFDEKTISPWFNKPSLLFTKLKANGTIHIFSNSIALINPQANTTNIGTEGYNINQISSTKIILQEGYGFYTIITAYNPSITLQGNQTDYLMAGDNKVEGQKLSIEINGYVTFLIRQPKLSVNGEIQFENFYMLHPSTIYTDGRNTTLNGNITLSIYVSGIALPYKFNSPIRVKYAKPLMEFNEIQFLSLLTPYIILIIILMLSMKVVML